MKKFREKAFHEVISFLVEGGWRLEGLFGGGGRLGVSSGFAEEKSHSEDCFMLQNIVRKRLRQSQASFEYK